MIYFKGDVTISRPLRIVYPGAYYHVMNRGLSRADIFRIDDDYEMFLEALKESSKFFDVKIIAYCLMTNHYHLLLTTPKGNLPRFMRHASGVYTQRFNRYHKTDGPLFRGRYKSVLVQEDEYLTHLVRYIHLNPVQANLVQDPKDYPWSSHRHYLKAKDEEWLRVTGTLKFFSPSLRTAKKAYTDFIRDGVDPKTKAFYAMKKSGSIFGDVDFVEDIKEKYLTNQSGSAHEVPDLRPLYGERLISRIKKEVSGEFKVSEDSLSRSKRGEPNKPRTFAMALARDMSGLHLGELTKHFGVGSYKTISHHYRKLVRSFAEDKMADRSYAEIKKRLSN